jgi:U5 snRNP spliceosome subunit
LRYILTVKVEKVKACDYLGTARGSGGASSRKNILSPREWILPPPLAPPPESEPPAPPPPPAVVVADWACTMTSGAEVLSSVGHVRCSSGFFSQTFVGRHSVAAPLMGLHGLTTETLRLKISPLLLQINPNNLSSSLWKTISEVRHIEIAIWSKSHGCRVLQSCSNHVNLVQVARVRYAQHSP